MLQCDLPPQGLDQVALVIVDSDLQWHLANCVGGAGEAGVVGANGVLNAVEHAFLDVRTMHIFLGYHVHSFAHGIVVVPGRDDQVHLGELTILVGCVIVDQGAARGFDDSNAVTNRLLVGVENIGAQDVGVFE